MGKIQNQGLSTTRLISVRIEQLVPETSKNNPIKPEYEQNNSNTFRLAPFFKQPFTPRLSHQTRCTTNHTGGKSPPLFGPHPISANDPFALSESYSIVVPYSITKHRQHSPFHRNQKIRLTLTHSPPPLSTTSVTAHPSPFPFSIFKTFSTTPFTQNEVATLNILKASF